MDVEEKEEEGHGSAQPFCEILNFHGILGPGASDLAKDLVQPSRGGCIIKRR